MEKYVLVTFPEIHDFMVHKRWGECIFCQEITGHPCPDSAYMVPEDLYNEVCLVPNYIREFRKNLSSKGKKGNLSWI